MYTLLHVFALELIYSVRIYIVRFVGQVLVYCVCVSEGYVEVGLLEEVGCFLY